MAPVPRLGFLIAAAAALVLHQPAAALQPPTREQLARYRQDGSLGDRVAAAYLIGNHRVAPHLLRGLGAFSAGGADLSEAMPSSLPATGRPNVFALLIEFADERATLEASHVDRGLFGDGYATWYPYESLSRFYLRSSYGLLDIRGTTLGWYRTPYPRSAVPQTTAGREALISEAVSHFDRLGHDFSRYDNDGDGRIDYFIVLYAGPTDEWTDFWWAYYQTWSDGSYVVDGKRFGWYSFQAEGPSPYSPRVVIHETGHALGLPDYYDYDDPLGCGPEGPPGGLGGLDMMDHNWGDHNGFSKLLLGWVTPRVLTEGSHDLSLRPSDAVADLALLMPGDPPSGPYAEYFLVQYRRRVGNDADLPTDGLMIWHVDARLHELGGVLFDNSSTDHKLLRLMEADGLEEIERGERADAGDVYRPGDALGTATTPSSHRYDGAPTNLTLDAISQGDGAMRFQVSLGSGCAVTCEAAAPVTARPWATVRFAGSTELSNCRGTPSLAWQLDGEPEDGATALKTYPTPGAHTWRLVADLGDASCSLEGTVLVCADPRCWQWQTGPAMRSGRAAHAASVLADGRVLVAGGGGPPELFDPESATWTETAPSRGAHLTATSALLGDGRVLVVGSTPGDPVNAEIYDPETGAWTATGQLAADRLLHVSARLADGRVLVAGGCWLDEQGACSRPVTRAEVFDPRTETWAAAGTLDEWHLDSTLTALEDGRALLVGYWATRVWEPTTNRWRRIAGPRVWRHQHTAARLADGRVLVISGYFTRRSELFDPATDSWGCGPAMDELRRRATATLLPNGRVLVAGGMDKHGAAIRTVEIYDPVAGAWAAADPLADPRYAHAASALSDGTVLVTGGTATAQTPDMSQWERSSAAERFTVPDAPPPPRRPLGRLQPASRP